MIENTFFRSNELIFRRKIILILGLARCEIIALVTLLKIKSQSFDNENCTEFSCENGQRANRTRDWPKIHNFTLLFHNSVMLSIV